MAKKPQTPGTPATLALTRAGIAFTAVLYSYDPDADRLGVQAAEAIGEPPARVFKTLMAEIDGNAVCVVVPSDHEVSMKKLATAFGGKSARMMKPADAERITGFRVGGISPFGQKKRVPTAFARQAADLPYLYTNGGQRGLQVRLVPADALRASAAILADLTAE
ncbi:Cys-tRNA(Pro) deacylase [Gluconacetobacter sp. 1b LMG 1731]|uniref:Cys-tRNA(Pro)/Cys-tRNA(Cys) deacylase n=1 Tax=Gluconacetobacter dulcium TaxID=2729096 RepID=A0A7W4IIZ5_9PROT|nr:Cys-tRNA(Pro) deacylase [Gluconacetobacter dulcium]MBB2163779.1 Cys-tRNA(Pro) deacylase [Gluconacetobacter dulcium]MBB2193105.1 Cys-tRNA(Pro) deacylase [Gluconacetobacter dulcium]